MARPPDRDRDRAEIVEDVHAEWFAHLDGVPGLEVHCDPDISWKLSAGSAWSNCAVRVRLAARNARDRLDDILARYQENGRGAGFWVSASAQPEQLESLLKWRLLRCRKYYPAMYCDLRRSLPEVCAKSPIYFETVTDYAIFRNRPHPSIGRITTQIRRFQLDCQQRLASRSPRRAWELMALSAGQPVGICTLFMGEKHAGLFDVGVLESMRNQGVGRALVRHACAFAQERGSEGVILIATNMGYSVYQRAGFDEVARFGFWYTAHP